MTIRFSHCDAAGIVYFPHYFDMFNGVIEDWYKAELKHDYAELVMGERLGFPFVHIECDFKIPSMMGEVIDLTLLVERIGRSSLSIAIVCHRDGLSAAARPHGHGGDVARHPQAGADAASRCAKPSRRISEGRRAERNGRGSSRRHHPARVLGAAISARALSPYHRPLFPAFEHLVALLDQRFQLFFLLRQPVGVALLIAGARETPPPVR